MWQSRTKDDLIIEVWKKLGRPSIGADEISAMIEAIRGRFGERAVDSPMRIARHLADHGVGLRHAEIMRLWIDWVKDRPNEAEFSNLLDLGELSSARLSIHRAEDLRRKFKADNDKDGLRRLRETAIEARNNLLKETRKRPPTDRDREMAEWLAIWLQSPEAFESWVKLRQRSPDFQSKFGNMEK